MKIKTITCHDVYNCGASLQTYSLMKHLENSNHEVEIIDYKPDYLSNHYKLFKISNPKYEKNIGLKFIYLTLKFPERILALMNKRKYDKFKKDYLKITQMRYESNEDLKANLPEADTYIAGSDQIWNTVFENGKDPAFYLDFVPNEKNKISYAASFATESVPKVLLKKTYSMIERLDHVGVREISGLDILESMGIKNGVQVLDPVFLLDKEYWNHMCLKLNDNEKYILVYDFDNSYIIEEAAKKIAKDKNLKIYTVFKSRYSDKHIKNMGPLEFISYINNAEYVISNSFHATAFSIIFEKQFYVVNRDEKINTRMRDVLSILDIENRLIKNKSDLCDINKAINYEDVNCNLEKLIRVSKQYLKKSIGV